MKKVGLKGKKGSRNTINQKLMSLASGGTVDSNETANSSDVNNPALLGAALSQGNTTPKIPGSEDVANLISKIKQAVDSKQLNPAAVRQVMAQAGGSVGGPRMPSSMSNFGPRLRMGGPRSDFPPRMSNPSNFPMRMPNQPNMGGPPWRGNFPPNMASPPLMRGPPRPDGPPNIMSRGMPPKMDGPPIGNQRMPPPTRMDGPRPPRVMGPGDGPPPRMGPRFNRPPRPPRMGGPMNRPPFDGPRPLMSGHNSVSQGPRRPLKS